MDNNQDGLQNGYPFSLQGINEGAFVEVRLL